MCCGEDLGNRRTVCGDVVAVWEVLVIEPDGETGEQDHDLVPVGRGGIAGHAGEEWHGVRARLVPGALVEDGAAQDPTGHSTPVG